MIKENKTKVYICYVISIWLLFYPFHNQCPVLGYPQLIASLETKPKILVYPVKLNPRNGKIKI